MGGDWQNSGTYTGANSTIIFNGSGLQNISGTSVTTFGNAGTGGLTINKSSDMVRLIQDVNVDGALTLTNGIIDCGFRKLTIGAAGTATAGSNVSHVNGKLARVYNTPGSKRFSHRQGR